MAGFPVAASLCVGGGCGVDGRCAVVSQRSCMQFPVIVSGKMRSGSWFPNNLARNSLACLSNIEIGSLELQRLWRLLNCQANELRAKFLTRGLGARGVGYLVGRGVVVQRDVGPRKFLKKCARGEGNRATREMSTCHSNDTRYCGDCSSEILDLVFRGGHALHLVEARTGRRAAPPPTVPRPRPTRAEHPRRVEHASEQHRRPQECRARGGTEMNNNLPEQTCGNAEKTGQGP